MIVRPIKTRRVLPGDKIPEIFHMSIPELAESSIIVVTSKIVALCENRVIPKNRIKKTDLIKSEADLFQAQPSGFHQYIFTIKQNTLIPAAGIDESNSGGQYVLWPKDPQNAATRLRSLLKKHYKLQNIGLIIIDSVVTPLRYGTTSTVIGYSGFRAINNYRGKKDLFGRPFKVSRASVANGLAAAAGVVMGEGAEQTPIAIIEDLPFVQFQDRAPTAKELNDFYITNLEDDLFWPFLSKIKWLKGNKNNNRSM